MKKPTQAEKILRILQNSDGWVSGRYFSHEMWLTQYHTRIKELEEKGHHIEHSNFRDEFGFVSYRIIEGNQLKL